MNNDTKFTTEIKTIFDRETKTRTTHFWGGVYQVAPVLINEPMGDGLHLIALQSLDTRPQYYLVRIDSSWVLGSERFFDRLDEIYDHIEEEVGPRHWTDDDGKEVDDEWPAFDFGCGQAWWSVADISGCNAVAMAREEWMTS